MADTPTQHRRTRFAAIHSLHTCVGLLRRPPLWSWLVQVTRLPQLTFATCGASGAGRAEQTTNTGRLAAPSQRPRRGRGRMRCAPPPSALVLSGAGHAATSAPLASAVRRGWACGARSTDRKPCSSLASTTSRARPHALRSAVLRAGLWRCASCGYLGSVGECGASGPGCAAGGDATRAQSSMPAAFVCELHRNAQASESVAAL